jgi:hypothetical protein
MLKTHAQKERGEKAIPAAQRIFKDYGLLGFYRGFPIRATRSVFHALFTVWFMDQKNALPDEMKIK